MKAGNRKFKGRGEIRMNGNYEVAQEKNEKNKAFRKRLKNFYIGLYGFCGVLSVFPEFAALTVIDLLVFPIHGIFANVPIVEQVWRYLSILRERSCNDIGETE